jgi:hypothetical protein
MGAHHGGSKMERAVQGFSPRLRTAVGRMEIDRRRGETTVVERASVEQGLGHGGGDFRCKKEPVEGWIAHGAFYRYHGVGRWLVRDVNGADSEWIFMARVQCVGYGREGDEMTT